jgi:hypothetical protein
MTKDVIPGSREKLYHAQQALIPDGYEMPPVFGAAMALLWENRHSGQRRLKERPSRTYTRCKETLGPSLFLLTVGSFAPTGLDICANLHASMEVGVAAWRKFRP